MKKFIYLMVLFFLLSGCMFKKEGQLAINIKHKENPIVDLSTKNMNIVEYRVIADGPKKESKNDKRRNKFRYTVKGSYICVDKLVKGMWDIKINAYNKNNEVIAKGFEKCKVYEDVLLDVNVFVNPVRFDTVVNHTHASVEKVNSIPAHDLYSLQEMKIIYIHSNNYLFKSLDRMDDFLDNRDFSIANNTIYKGFKNINAEINIENIEIFLDEVENMNADIVLWEWSENQFNTINSKMYLYLIDDLIFKYQNTEFIFMTVSNDGTGPGGNIHIANKKIREYCIKNKRWLFDVADIEKYDPDNNFYGDIILKSGLYDSDGDGVLNPELDSNWQAGFEEANSIVDDEDNVLNYYSGAKWYNCEVENEYSVSTNMKTYALWYLLALISENKKYN